MTRVILNDSTEFILVTEEAELMLRAMENAGMKPPRLPEEICQAILHIYYMGYSLYQWEEDALKDEKVVAELKRRAEYAALTPEQKRERREAARTRLNSRRTNE